MQQYTEKELLEATKIRFEIIRDGKPGETVLGCLYCVVYGRSIYEISCIDCTWREQCNDDDSGWMTTEASLKLEEYTPESHIKIQMGKIINAAGGTIPPDYKFSDMPEQFQDYVNKNISWCKDQLKKLDGLTITIKKILNGDRSLAREYYMKNYTRYILGNGNDVLNEMMHLVLEHLFDTATIKYIDKSEYADELGEDTLMTVDKYSNKMCEKLQDGEIGYNFSSDKRIVVREQLSILNTKVNKK